MTKISNYWLEIINEVPGYDPLRDSEGFIFDEEKAELACDFFPDMLTHIEGSHAGNPFILELWQMAIVANLFGWVDPNGFRRYRESLIYVPRKNGKTCLVAGICNLVLFCDGEAGAQLYCAASDRDQAAIVFRHARGMVLQNPELESCSRVFESTKKIEFGTSFTKVISAEANTKHGFNTHLAVIDELHAQPNRDLVDVLTTSTGSRLQPLIIYMTTADFDRPSICNETHDYAIRVRDEGGVDPRFLPVIYESPLDADWSKRETWEASNPNLGVSVTYENMEAACRKAQELPSGENTFRRLRLNTRTQQDVRWLDLERWDKCRGDGPTLDGLECYGGLDLSSTTDLTAFAMLFPGEGCFHLRVMFWAPKEQARLRAKRDKVPYLDWARDGWLTLTDGDTIDYDVVRRDIGLLAEKYNMKGVGIDRWAASQITNQLSQDGLDMVPFGQGFSSMSAPSKEMERQILNRSVLHDGNPVLRWMVGHVAIEEDAAGNIKPSKKKSTERIDGIVAIIMSLGVWVLKTKEDHTSVYEGRGMMFL